MVKRPTITDLARVSGVSVATVDRVLNSRLPVRKETARRVYDAATEIGYHAAGLIKQRMRQELPEYRLGFLLLRGNDVFYGDFARELELAVAQSQRFRGVATIDFAASLAPDEIAAQMRRLAAKSRSIAVVGPDHPNLTAVVETLKARGQPVFSLLSDFAAGIREGYVGLDNRKVGRSAAWMIAKAARKPGKVALFVGSHRFHGHELREIGFRSFFREHAPDFTVMETLVNLEANDVTHDAMLDILARHPDLAGCYVAGGGMEGAVSALRTANPAEMPVVICNEINAVSRAALADNILTMVISTPLAALCRELVGLMAHAIESGAANAPGQTFLPFDIYLPENI
ncbi:LacI family DNA-binding transcriptional regulator [Mesorhizobium sp. M2D.F.Ca.ET.185.01.1.1]|uniref:LacI family DNA-binding transcriptional regulator n=1 Tax=unclassified Mesorhizobium TaxID=325217 RepID=UPI000FCB0C69|nr:MULTISPECIES: LacI family DNA-binding transcriptional regulator [unclassified Mesorhizobium]TGP82033.1 LacI family DNA-binding transcriptional regulator [bacterium M00.F.Ca.ET.227.01.1.1]TGP92075.1 LacI family DNA-binding transcriptional regulator [bacterium M00.F.Ca.ET.221.01.1.1]TGP95140.1 LacI family DNA-binding transcriptional regulator [bacterium M00.F.Ca.ET.222.01.1.1]TGU09755.1 LacI family DNA-binding transcriptional regulator [bacterium M00.F.Ca.ET.163.01.1.1]TGU38939.1 LacI family 